jgi:uncharacterized repeat protein (TIGR03803 family)
MSVRRSTDPIRTSVLLALFATANGAAAGTATPGDPPDVLYSFEGTPDAEYPSTDLVIDAEGNLYGMTVLGGTFGSGTVFRLSPSKSGSKSGWTETVLYSFTSGPDGGQPYGGVTLDDAGNLYGTAVVGGSGGSCVEDGCGVVWKLTRSGATYTQSVIHDFSGADGFGPGGPVVLDRAGNLYGMTPTGGTYGFGVVYQLTPRDGGGWTYTLLHAFSGRDDGATGSAGRLLVDDAQNVYGVATVGGAYGVGNVFRLSQDATGVWKQTVLYSVQGQPDGVFPYGGLVRDGAGNFYGTTYYGGALGLGTVYKLSQKGGAWRERVLYSFTGGSDGGFSISHLVLDSAGNLYGTTSEGGSAGCGCGTIFELSPPATALGKRRWQLNVLHRFEGSPDGGFAYNGLVADGKGNLYGTTVHGGDDDDGAVYVLTP